jgi:hypothetical protein
MGEDNEEQQCRHKHKDGCTQPKHDPPKCRNIGSCLPLWIQRRGNVGLANGSRLAGTQPNAAAEAEEDHATPEQLTGTVEGAPRLPKGQVFSNVAYTHDLLYPYLSPLKVRVLSMVPMRIMILC